MNIRLRGAIKDILMKAGMEDSRYMSARWVARANNRFWKLIDENDDLSDVEDAWYGWFFTERGMV